MWSIFSKKRHIFFSPNKNLVDERSKRIKESEVFLYRSFGSSGRKSPYFHYNPGDSSSYESGNILYDLVNDNNSTIVGNPTHTYIENGYFRFDGNDYITSPNLYGDGSIHTVEVWVRPSENNVGIWSDLGQTTPNIDYHFSGAQINTSGSESKISIGLWNGFSIEYVSKTGEFLNKWTQIVRTYDGNTLKGYINGELVGSLVMNYDLPPDEWVISFGSGDTTSINNEVANNYQGRYGAIKYYKEVLEGSEVLDNYNSGFVQENTFPKWEDNNLPGPDFLNPLDYQTKNGTFNPNTTSLFGSLSLSRSYAGGALAPNGKIYVAPMSPTNVLEIDTITNTVSTFGSLPGGGDKWEGSVLAPNGKIYGIPFDSSNILEIDPNTQTTTLFGSLPGGDSKWRGGVLAPNGKIYGIPSNTTQVLEIDPETQTTTLFGSLPSGTEKWSGGVLAPNGKIYGIPGNSDQVLEIDPETQTTTLFGSLGTGLKWFGGVLSTNGKIYGIPLYSDNILEIDPETQTTTLFGSLSTSREWAYGALAPNGKIYGMPFDSSDILEIDPETQTTNLIPSPIGGGRKWRGAVLGPNGKIYGIPHSASSVLVIGVDNPQPEDMVLSRYLNKL